MMSPGFGRNPEIASPEALNNLYAGMRRFYEEQPLVFGDMTPPTEFFPAFEGQPVRALDDEPPRYQVELGAVLVAQALPDVAQTLRIDENSRVFMGLVPPHLKKLESVEQTEEGARFFVPGERAADFRVEHYTPAVAKHGRKIVQAVGPMRQVDMYYVEVDTENPAMTTGTFADSYEPVSLGLNNTQSLRDKLRAEDMFDPDGCFTDTESIWGGDLLTDLARREGGKISDKVTVPQAAAWQALLDHINIPGA
ncbi:MAG TPA: hypothetical protein VLG11_06490 [Candidatus Saccharimonadales bacterium]|nr:hypothetical protein [Candidatus Saccharimonadales bacterium]